METNLLLKRTKLELQKAKFILEIQGQLNPMFVFYKGNKLVPIVTNFRDDNDKEKVVSILKRKVKESNIDYYAFMSECWYYTSSKVPTNIIIRPTNHPERKEAIAVSGFSKEGNRIQMLLPFTRNKDKIEFGNAEIAKDFATKFELFETPKLSDLELPKILEPSDDMIERAVRTIVKKEVENGKMDVERANKILNQLDNNH